MYKEIFQNFTDSHLIVIGFMLFIGTFVGSLIWTLFVQNKSFYDQMSLIPLSKGDQDGRE